jgi:predicted TIM-barrel fold metal-dependent hydrolase
MSEPVGTEAPGRVAVFDAHLHIVDPRFPQVENQGFVAEAFTVDDYRRALPDDVDLVGGAVVAGSYQGYDQQHLLASLRTLGPSFVGVAQVPLDVVDGDLDRLDDAGVRAIRFNLARGMVGDLQALTHLGRRVAERHGWHVELYVSSTALDQLEPLVRGLPRVVIDHLGLEAAGLPDLLRHVERGGYVKATGFGRTDLDVSETLQAIVEVDPSKLVFGTDLPSTRAPRPFERGDLDLLLDVLAPADAERALWRNAVSLYRPASPSPRDPGPTVTTS